MLAPLLQWPPALGVDLGSSAALTLGRGQILGLCGPGWREALAAFAATARETNVPYRTLEWGDSGSDAAVSAAAAPLWLVASTAANPGRIGALLAALEKLARSGGGAILGADAFPPETRESLTRLLEFPLTPGPGRRHAALLDDLGMSVNFLRRGEWGAFYFPLSVTGWPGARSAQLSITGGGRDWMSDPADLAPWRSFVPQPTGCTVSFAAAWPAGRYEAALLIDRGSGRQPVSAPLPFTVRDSDVAPDLRAIESGPPLHWRFTGLPTLLRRPAAMTLRLPPRARLDFSENDGDYLPQGWHNSEPTGNGAFRRWTTGEAVAALGGTGHSLVLGFYDFRPRAEGQEQSALTVMIDGETHREFTWRDSGFHGFDIPWIGDGLTHEVRLRLQPTWSPSQEGLDDHRVLGILVERLQIADE